MDKAKPLMLTHEVEVAKGGGPLETIQSELDNQQLSDAVFPEERVITSWYRIADFQLISLKVLASFTLLQTPLYKGKDAEIYVPGELLETALHFVKPVIVYTSPHNPGAQAFAADLMKAYSHQHYHHHHFLRPRFEIESGVDTFTSTRPKAVLTHSNSTPDQLQQPHGISTTETRPTCLLANSKALERLGKSNLAATHFLLYLKFDTYLNDAGQQLAEELRKARAAGLPIVMAHENDLALGGCEFSRFFTTTPQDLINDGLYKALAFAAYPGAKHRAVSMALLAKALGAVARHTKAGKPVRKHASFSVRLRKIKTITLGKSDVVEEFWV